MSREPYSAPTLPRGKHVDKGDEGVAPEQFNGSPRWSVHWAGRWPFNWPRGWSFDWSRWGAVHWARRWLIDWSRWRAVHWTRRRVVERPRRWPFDWSRWRAVHWAGRWPFNGAGWWFVYRSNAVLQQHTSTRGVLGVPAYSRLRRRIPPAQGCLGSIGRSALATASHESALSLTRPNLARRAGSEPQGARCANASARQLCPKPPQSHDHSPCAEGTPAC